MVIKENIKISKVLLFKIMIAFFLVLFIISSCAISKQNSNQSNLKLNELNVLFINVGKADCILISFDGMNYLIDTGTKSSLPQLIRTLRNYGVQKLDGVFLTHNHKDHIGGLNGLLELFDIDKLYLANITNYKKKGSNAVIDIAEKFDKVLIRLNSGDEITLSDNNKHAVFKVLGPVVFDTEDENDNSLVMLLDFFDNDFLFTGDMQFSQESTLLNRKLLTKCEVLKVGNHGNDDATSKKFIDTILPDIAIISTNKDLASDSENIVIKKLESINAKVYQTKDYEVGIQLKCNKDEIEIVIPDYPTSTAISSIKILAVDKKKELVTLQNTGSFDIELTGWWLLSKKGDEMYFFSKGTIIKSNDTLTIGSGDNIASADFFWTDKNMWKKDKKDIAILYDFFGNIADSFIE